MLYSNSRINTQLKTTSKKYLQDKDQEEQISLIEVIQDLKDKLQDVLECLQLQKQEHDQLLQKQRKKLQQKYQVIEKLLKTIYSFKMQNQQLRFQYERRFKLIKQMQNKYQNLLLQKNNKISHCQSVILYLENKIKKIDQVQIKNLKCSVLKTSTNNKNCNNNFNFNNNYNNVQKEMKKSCIQSMRNLEVTDHTIPLKRSHLSTNSKNSSSPSQTCLGRRQFRSGVKKVGGYEDCISFFQSKEYEQGNTDDIFDVDINLANKNLQCSTKLKIAGSVLPSKSIKNFNNSHKTDYKN